MTKCGLSKGRTSFVVFKIAIYIILVISEVMF